MANEVLDASDPACAPGSAAAAAAMPPLADRPLYYLGHFRFALDWIGARYHDLLAADEAAFIAGFQSLPTASQALLVRLIMRRGDLFRATRLSYPEIGAIDAAAQPLIACGWLDDRPMLSAHEVCSLLRKSELPDVPALPAWSGRKSDLLLLLRHAVLAPRAFDVWYPDAGECVYRVTVGDVCDRLRLIFFGNLHQEWSEFVVSELGLLAYEKVELSEASRGFRSRQEIDDYLHLHRCAEQFEQAAANDSADAADACDACDAIADAVEAIRTSSDWIAGRRAKLLFRIGRHHEQRRDFVRALDVYARCPHAQAWLRAVRVLEKTGRFDMAWALASEISQAGGEPERQQLARIVPRLQRKLGVPVAPVRRTPPLPHDTLVLDRPRDGRRVELLVRDHLHAAGAPVYYVENTLVNSLFGLLCWRAIFSAIPGAFFHPFQAAPADLYSPDFLARRHDAFAECFGQLASDRYRQTIMAHYREKAGIQSPFVAWDALDEDLLGHALDCLPAAHLRHWFERIAQDIAGNRSGFPDLIQFWPAQRRYRMIEVKGPGDRLQDSQARFLADCRAHDMPVGICRVQWRQEDDGSRPENVQR